MSKKEKYSTSDFEGITLSKDKKKLPLTTLGLTKAEKEDPPRSSLSSFYQTECYYTIAFYKPISKIFSYINE
ncbi:hypothetical protein D3C85_1579190 [compost metagenome]